MGKFIIVRHGSNAANQSRQNRRVLGTVEAVDSEAAYKSASEIWTCYNNQHFEAINLAGRTRAIDRADATEQDSYRMENA